MGPLVVVVGVKVERLVVVLATVVVVLASVVVVLASEVVLITAAVVLSVFVLVGPADVVVRVSTGWCPANCENQA